MGTTRLEAWDRYAAAALAGILAHPDWETDSSFTRDAADLATALLAERDQLLYEGDEEDE